MGPFYFIQGKSGWINFEQKQKCNLHSIHTNIQINCCIWNCCKIRDSSHAIVQTLNFMGGKWRRAECKLKPAVGWEERVGYVQCYTCTAFTERLDCKKKEYETHETENWRSKSIYHAFHINWIRSELKY